MCVMTQAQLDVNQKILDAMQALSIDNAEIKATLKHIDSKFDRVNADIQELKIATNEAANDAEIAKNNTIRLETEVKEISKDTDRLFEKFRERDKKLDSDRKWLLGTVIAVIGLFITIVSFMINYFIN